MSDRDKIKSIVNYIINNYSYDLNYKMESNTMPISSFFDNNKGVCASYAYLANILFRKANIESYELVSLNHAWNIVQLDNKYYYIDTTNLDNEYDEFLLKYFNFGSCFLTNPGENGYTEMEDYYAGNDKIIISKDLIHKIEKSEGLKNFCEKYPCLSFYYAASFTGSMLCFSIFYMLCELFKMSLEEKKQLNQFDVDNFNKKFCEIKLKRRT